MNVYSQTRPNTIDATQPWQVVLNRIQLLEYMCFPPFLFACNADLEHLAVVLTLASSWPRDVFILTRCKLPTTCLIVRFSKYRVFFNFFTSIDFQTLFIFACCLGLLTCPIVYLSQCLVLLRRKRQRRPSPATTKNAVMAAHKL